MKAIVKAIDLNGPAGFDEYWPEDVDSFGVWLTVQVGPDDQEGGHLFQILACSPDWIKKELVVVGPAWGRHMLILREYDRDLIVNEISRYVSNCAGSDFLEVAQKISRIGAWEFEDYQQ